MRMPAPGRYTRPRGLDGLVTRRAVPVGLGGLGGLTLPTEAQIIADVTAQGGWAAAMTDADKLSWASGGLGRELAPWVWAIRKRVAEMEPSARPAADLIREMRSVVVGGVGAGAWLDQLGDFVLARANSTGYRHLPADPTILAEIAMLRDYVRRYPDPMDRRARLMQLDIFDALGMGYRGELAPTGQYGNQNLQTAGEILASGTGTGTGTGSGGGNGTGSGTGAGSGTGSGFWSGNLTSPAQSVVNTVSGLPTPVLAAAGLAVAYFLFRGGR